MFLRNRLDDERWQPRNGAQCRRNCPEGVANGGVQIGGIGDGTWNNSSSSSNKNQIIFLTSLSAPSLESGNEALLY